MRHAIHIVILLVLSYTCLGADRTREGKLTLHEGGVTDEQVVQRDEEGKGHLRLNGTASPAEGAALRFRILRRLQTVRGFDWTPVEVSPDGQWAVEINGLPTGGPYRVELRLEDFAGQTLDQRDIDGLLVGDLWVMAGQSNMDGCGALADAEDPHEMVRSFSLADTWQVAEDPIHWCYESVYPVYLTTYVSPTERQPIKYKPRGAWPDWAPDTGAGLGVSFGKAVFEGAGVPIGLIVCSLGGSSMQQWNPELRERGDKALYGAMLQRIDKVGGKIKGVLWYQGESDTNSGSSKVYKEQLTRFIEAIRADQQNAAMPFFIVQLARMVGSGDSPPDEINAVRAAHLEIGQELRHAGVVAAIDLNMSSGAHLDTDGYKRVGRRLARLAAGKPGPMVESVSTEGKATHPVIRVRFANVTGSLHPGQRVSGVTIRSADGTDVVLQHLNALVDADAPGDVLLQCEAPIPPGATLWYGHGWDPFCNLTDDADMAVPAFGAAPLN